LTLGAARSEKLPEPVTLSPPRSASSRSSSRRSWRRIPSDSLNPESIATLTLERSRRNAELPADIRFRRAAISARIRQPEHWGDGIVRTQGMTRAEVETALARAGLEVPERERQEVADAAHFIEEMAERVRGKRAIGAEPAHIFPPPGT
jgi:hypothetical protein